MYERDLSISKNFNPILILLILSTLILFRLIFYFSGFMQEDAFIVFRSAFNFADYNIFSYNLDEHHTGVTSKIFGLLCYVFRLILKDYAVLGIIAFNSFLGLIASYFIFKAFEELIIHEDISKKLCLLLIIGINPTILKTGITGLEYGLVVLFISLLFLYISQDKNNYLLLISAIFLPITRIELVAVNLIIIFACFIYKNKKWLYLLFATFLGVLINFILNYYFDGSIFSSSATSKWMMTSNQVNRFDLENLISSFSQWFLFSNSFFLGITTKYMINFISFIISIAILILVVSNFKYLIFYKFKQIPEKEKTLLLCLSLSIIFVPASYILSGNVMSWYLLPFSFLTYVLLGYTFIKSKYFNLRNLSFVLFLLFFLSSLQFLILKNKGFQENSYRSYVGQFIYNHSENKKKDTLFLEPAGYIPYFAKIKTYDTVGLASPKIRKYRKKGVNNWWFNFIKNENPTYVVNRLDVNDDNFPDEEYIFSKSELEWFKKNYFKVKSFDYKNHVKNFGGAFKELYNLSYHASYHLFKLK